MTLINFTNDGETLEIKTETNCNFSQIVDELNYRLTDVNTAVVTMLVITGVSFDDKSENDVFSRFLYNQMLFMVEYVNIVDSYVCIEYFDIPNEELAFDNCVIVSDHTAPSIIIEATQLTFTDCTFFGDTFENFSLTDGSILYVQGNNSSGVRDIAATIHKKFSNCDINVYDGDIKM